MDSNEPEVGLDITEEDMEGMSRDEANEFIHNKLLEEKEKLSDEFIEEAHEYEQEINDVEGVECQEDGLIFRYILEGITPEQSVEQFKAAQKMAEQQGASLNPDSGNNE